MKGSTIAMIGGLIVLCVLAFSQMEISFLASGTAHSSPNANGALLVDGAGDSKLKVTFLMQTRIFFLKSLISVMKSVIGISCSLCFSCVIM
jgi:hypothetical protein